MLLIKTHPSGNGRHGREGRSPITSTMRKRLFDKLMQVALSPEVSRQLHIVPDHLHAPLGKLSGIQRRVVGLVISLCVVVVASHVDGDLHQSQLAVCHDGHALDHSMVQQLQCFGIRETSTADWRRWLFCTLGIGHKTVDLTGKVLDCSCGAHVRRNAIEDEV